MFLAAAGGLAVAQMSADPAVVGRKALDYLLAERYSELTSMFNPAMKSNLTLDMLQGRISSELTSFGKIESVGQPILARDGKVTLVSFPVDFSTTKINIQFHIEESGQLAAIHFRPVNSPLPAAWKPPPYGKPELFHEREVTIGSNPWQLGGTLTVPNAKGPFPAVILVHGPGPNDRDESIGADKLFADLAEGLSSRGIAVLRYDKRTKVYGRQMSEQPFTLHEETIDDALSAAAFLRLQPEIESAQLYMAGHSLGGYAAPRIAREDGKLAGVIFLAANARPVQEVILEQTEYLAAAGVLPPDEAQRRLDKLKVETEKVKALKPGTGNPPVILGFPYQWLLDLKDYDPAVQAGRLSVPLLFLQGERDFQVSMKDFNCWKSALAGHSNAIFHSYPDLNHLFIPGQGKSLPADYLVPGNASPIVVADIASWIATPKS